MPITVRTLAVPATLAALAFGPISIGHAAAIELGTPPNCDPVCLAADLGPVHLNQDDVVVHDDPAVEVGGDDGDTVVVDPEGTGNSFVDGSKFTANVSRFCAPDC